MTFNQNSAPKDSEHGPSPNSKVQEELDRILGGYTAEVPNWGSDTGADAVAEDRREAAQAQKEQAEKAQDEAERYRRAADFIADHPLDEHRNPIE